MKIPTIQGIIDRRVLVNFTVDSDVIQKIIPQPFRPKIYKGKAIIGICLIRLKHIRPKGLPSFIGVSSENGAHRIAVEWAENGEQKEGVYIPRRDTSSLLNSLAGGRIFPGRHFHAKFDIKEGNGHYHIAFKSSDGTTISIDGEKTEKLNSNSIFQNLETASKTVRIHEFWCAKSSIQATPTIFINGFQLPDIYQIEDIQRIAYRIFAASKSEVA